MAEQNYQQLLDDLHNGKITEFEIKPTDFQDFQPIFHSYPYRSQIEGKAHRGGALTYRLKKQ